MNSSFSSAEKIILITHLWVLFVKLLFLQLKKKIHIFMPVCNVLIMKLKSFHSVDLAIMGYDRLYHVLQYSKCAGDVLLGAFNLFNFSFLYFSGIFNKNSYSTRSLMHNRARRG